MSYTGLSPNQKITKGPPPYQDNKSFWLDINKHVEGEPVSLKEFHLTQWVPRSPGTYFLPESEHERERAMDYVSGNEYLPQGKEAMTLSGIGSIRLRSKIIDSKKYFLLGATSNGVTHQGIPVAVETGEYQKIIEKLKEFGGCICNVSGSLQLIPEVISLVQYSEQVPKFYVLADRIEYRDSSQENVLVSSIAVMFRPSSSSSSFVIPDEDFESILPQMWSFCSFDPTSFNKLKDAINWLKDYALRYYGLSNPAIFSDFDEYYNHFTVPVEFTLNSLIRGDYDRERFRIYIEHLNQYSQIVNMNGDLYNNISNSQIANRSNVQDSLNVQAEKHE